MTCNAAWYSSKCSNLYWQRCRRDHGDSAANDMRRRPALIVHHTSRRRIALVAVDEC